MYNARAPERRRPARCGSPLAPPHPAYDVDLYPVDDLSGAPQQAWTVPNDGTVHVTPSLSVAPGACGTVTFTVKRRGALVTKHAIAISNGAVPDTSFDLPVIQGDHLFLDFFS